MVLDKINACQRSDCADVREWHHSVIFALSGQELDKMDLKLCLFQVPFSSPTLDVCVPRHSREIQSLLCLQSSLIASRAVKTLDSPVTQCIDCVSDPTNALAVVAVPDFVH